MCHFRPFFSLGLLGLSLSILTSFASARDLTIDDSDLRQIGNGPLILPGVKGLPADPGLAVIDPSLTDPVAGMLRRLVSSGTSQGFDGLLYDNRDRAHSILKPSLFPNLTFLRYGADLQKRGLDYGFAGPILIPELVFGNSSTAITSGTRPRSLVRNAMTTTGGPARAFRDYTANSIYVYPEHRDHDLVDLYPANWPYTITSQGSSSSDIPFLKAVAMTLAAFRPDTRLALQDAGLIAPTVQMILRRNLTLVRKRSDYLSGAAHPTVFNADWIQPGRMVQQAAALRPEDIAPLVRLKVVDESFQTEAGLNGDDEHLFTTPSAVARIWHGPSWQQTMLVSADATRDPNGRDLSFDWVLLRGDPDRVKIEPLDNGGRTARITVNWHDAFVLDPRSPDTDIPRKTSRVDIGVFAWNGKTDSAPAMISISFPTHQRREYATGPDDIHRLRLIDYDAQRRNESYDPVLFWSAAWTDLHHYDDSGIRVGWSREQDSQRVDFDAKGIRKDGAVLSYRVDNRTGSKPTLQGVIELQGN